MKLSQKRAQSVADVLQARFNLDKSIINPVGRGEEDLIDSNNTDAAHQLNRRIEISIEETLMLPVQRTE
jgi:OOP family OmpA-OmpF porin